MSNEITYLGVENEEKTDNTKKRKTKEKTSFKVNKHNKKVDKFISSTKKSFISKDTAIFISIVLLVLILKPITFLQKALDNKREYYAMTREYAAETKNYNLDVDINLNNLWNKIVFASGKDYYFNCKGTMLMPVDGYVVCQYDFMHQGIDMVSKTYPGNVYAACNGRVYSVSYSEKYKNEVMIEHTINGMTLYTFYGNLSNVSVQNGQYVDTNTIIGTEFGDASNPAISVDGKEHHVHFAVRKTPNENTGLNPLIFAKYR